MEMLEKRLQEQKGRHQGGSKWINTAGTSPFGAYGYNPEDVSISRRESRHRRAIKVWDRREFINFDDSVKLGIRNIKVVISTPPATVADNHARAGLMDHPTGAVFGSILIRACGWNSMAPRSALMAGCC